MTLRGQQITVRLRDGDKVVGWLYAKTPLGIYVALDRTAGHIRFIPAETWSSTNYGYDDVVTFANTPDDTFGVFSDSISPSTHLIANVTDALQRVDYNSMRRIYVSLAADANRFDGWYDRFEFKTNNESTLSGFGDVAVSVRLHYEDLLSELERAGLDESLLEHANELRQLASRFGIPSFDLAFGSTRFDNRGFLLETLLAGVREHDFLREQDLGRKALRHVTNSRLILLTQTDDGEEVNPVKKTTGRDTDASTPRRLRTIAAVAKMAIGGSLAAANVTAGVFAGIVAALPTLGIGTVAGAVGVATSAYTGLNAACDGLKDLATAIDNKRQSLALAI